MLIAGSTAGLKAGTTGITSLQAAKANGIKAAKYRVRIYIYPYP
ncbi:MAG: hypothetical protein ACJASV_003025 [Pseudorhodobacter sp.]|jgi:hypothetical protein